MVPQLDLFTVAPPTVSAEDRGFWVRAFAGTGRTAPIPLRVLGRDGWAECVIGADEIPTMARERIWATDEVRT